MNDTIMDMACKEMHRAEMGITIDEEHTWGQTTYSVHVRVGSGFDKERKTVLFAIQQAIATLECLVRELEQETK